MGYAELKFRVHSEFHCFVMESTRDDCTLLYAKIKLKLNESIYLKFLSD